MDAHESEFRTTLEFLQAEIAAFGVPVLHDAATRQLYNSEIAALQTTVTAQVRSGQLTWQAAASQAHELRNSIMEAARTRTSPLGRALAQTIKTQGRTLNEVVARQTTRMFGAGADFHVLSMTEQNRVYMKVVQSASTNNAQISSALRNTAKWGRSLLVLSLAVSAYQVLTSEEPLAEAGNEAALFGASVGGSYLGGAVAAGLLCGPGAPICVGLGIFVGGALAAYATDHVGRWQ